LASVLAAAFDSLSFLVNIPKQEFTLVASAIIASRLHRVPETELRAKARETLHEYLTPPKQEDKAGS
jgi:hypothetical protein